MSEVLFISINNNGQFCINKELTFGNYNFDVIYKVNNLNEIYNFNHIPEVILYNSNIYLISENLSILYWLEARWNN